jgi:riboflavin kinase / FMN adenylyltransferase
MPGPLRVYRSVAELPADFGPSAVTIGNFDGVHHGHREILRRLRTLADAHGWKASALTFDPHPTRIVAPERTPKLMTAPARRAQWMGEAGVDQVLILPFDAEIARLTPEEFAEELLARRMGARAVLVGENFRFGCRQAGDVRTLEALGQRLGFAVNVVPAVRFRGQVVSSSSIRALILSGRVALAKRLLGRPYAVDGRVVTGRGVGSKQTVPTLNLETDADVIPARGVYVTRANGISAVTNVGYRPTFGESDRLSIETFLLTGEGSSAPSASPTLLTIEFLARLREERKFNSPEALKSQILFDVRAAQRYFRRLKALCRPAIS